MMIKNNRVLSFVASLLLIALSFGATIAPAQAQGQQQRERRVSQPNNTARPSQTPKPTPTPQPAATTQPERLALVYTPSTTAPKTLDELRAGIVEVLRRPELNSAQMAIKIASLDTGRTIYEENAGKLLHPASNMKIYTVAAALDRLSPDFRFKTSAYARAMPDANGTLRGDLIIYGRGDPTFSASFNNGDYYKAIDDFASRIIASGVKRIEGNIIGD